MSESRQLPQRAVAPLKTNVLAIVSLVAAFVIPVVAVVTGYIAQSQIRRTGEEGRGMARAGVIIGMVGIVAQLAVITVWLSTLFGLLNGANGG
jgi:ammonia channel protein AmtB